jgi:hypothetical protein
MDCAATSLSSHLALYFTFTFRVVDLIIAVAIIGGIAFVIHQWTAKR